MSDPASGCSKGWSPRVSPVVPSVSSRARSDGTSGKDEILIAPSSPRLRLGTVPAEKQEEVVPGEGWISRPEAAQPASAPDEVKVAGPRVACVQVTVPTSDHWSTEAPTVAADEGVEFEPTG